MIEVFNDVSISTNSGDKMKCNVYKYQERYYAIQKHSISQGTVKYDLIRFYERTRNGKYSPCSILPLPLLQSFSN